MKILFIDTETGGLSQNSALIQLSGIVQIGKMKLKFLTSMLNLFQTQRLQMKL